MKRIPILLLFLLGCFSISFAQNEVNIDDLIKQIEKAKADTNKVLLYDSLLTAYPNGENETKEGIYYTEDGLALAEKLDFNKGIGKMLNHQSTFLIRAGKRLEATKPLKQALAYFEKAASDDNDLVNTYLRLARLFERIGQLGEALENVQESILIIKEKEDKALLATAKGLIGRIYGRLGKHKQSLISYQEQLLIRRENGQLDGEAIIINNIGSTYKDLGEYDKGIVNIHQSLNINLRLNTLRSKNTIIFNYATLGEIYQLKGNIDSALYYARASLRVSVELNDPDQIAYGQNDIGRVLIAMKDNRGAISYLNKSYRTSKDLHNNEIEILSIQNLYEAYKNLGQFENAYKYLKEYLQIKENLWFDNSDKITQLQLFYASEQKQAEIDILNKEKSIRNSELEKEELIVYVAFTGVIIILVLFLYILRNYQKQRGVNKLLSSKNEEIENQKNEIEHSLDNIKLLSNIGQKVIVNLSIEKINETVYHNINALMKVDGLGIGIYNEDKSRIEFRGYVERGEILPFSYDNLNNLNRLSVWCFRNKKNVVINNADQDYKKYIETQLTPQAGEQLESILYFPLITNEKVIGVLTVQSFEKNTYTDYHCSILGNLAIYIAIALENANSYRQVKQSNKKVEATYRNVKLLSEMGVDITSNLEVDKIIEQVYESVNTLMDAPVFSIDIYNKTKYRLEAPASIEKNKTLPAYNYSLDDDDKLGVICFKRLKEIFINDFEKDYQKYSNKKYQRPLEGENPESSIFLPLIGKDETLGVVAVQSFKKNAYNEYHLNILRNLAIYISIALENADAFLKIEKSNAEVALQKETIEEKNITLAQQNIKVEQAYNNVKLLGEIGQKIIAKLSVEEIIATVYKSVNTLMDAPIFMIGIRNRHENVMEFEGAIEKGETHPFYTISLDDESRLVTHCFNQQQEIFVNNFRNEYSKYIPAIQVPIAGETPESIIYLPLSTQHREIGVITVQSFSTDAYSEYHLDILKNLAVYTVIALENAFIYKNLEDEVKERTVEIEQQKEELELAFKNLKVLSRMGQVLTGLLSAEAIIQAVYKNVKKLMDVGSFAIGIHKPEQEVIEFRGAIENSKLIPLFYHSVHDEHDKYSAWCLKYQREILVRDYSKDYNRLIKTMPTPKIGVDAASLIYMPLLVKGKAMGIITVQSFKKNSYTESHVNVLKSLASYVAIALDNAGTYSKIEEQNVEINKNNEKITSSINYAKRIQNAILPHRTVIEQSLPDSFIFFQPKDIVSGDFFWFHRKKNKVFIAVVDCTGHGVPGAFMSMIGNNFLNETVIMRGIEEPHEILTALNKQIRMILKQDETDNRDGMDVALCVIDIKKRKVEFSGAKNPLIYIEQDKEKNGLEYSRLNNASHLGLTAVGTSQLKIIKGDKMPIGGSPKEQVYSFNKHTLKLDNPTTLYMFTDGYQDQFGGSTNRKYLTTRFKNFLLKINDLPLSDQKEELSKEFENWKGNIGQTDDVLVIGIKI